MTSPESRRPDTTLLARLRANARRRYAGSTIEYFWSRLRRLSFVHIVGQLFGPTGVRSLTAVVFASALGFAGIIGVAGSMQNVYRQIFGVSHQNKTNILRLVARAVGVCGWVAFTSAINATTKGLP